MNAEQQVISHEDIVTEAAGRFVRACNDSVRERDIFQVALAGGSTPKALYKALAKPPYIDAVDWESSEVFFGDERNVQPQHEDSNYRMVSRCLLDHVPLVASQIHRMPGEGPDLERSAEGYEGVLRKRLIPDEEGVKAFGLVLLGLGPEGHTVSLFPGSPALEEQERWVVACRDPHEDEMRLSLTLKAINQARRVWFLVTGEEKAGVVASVLNGGGEGLPASRVDPTEGELLWLLDPAAASELDDTLA